MKFNAKQKNKTKPLLISIDDFSGGFNNLIDDVKMPPKFAFEATNMIQVQNGLWKTRWGTQYYGADIGNQFDGAQEYVKSDGTTELIAIAGGVAYKSTDGGTWTSISGATFTAGVQCYFLQMGGWDNTSSSYKSYLYICNGTDPLTRYDGSTLLTYTQISAPTNLSASRTGLTSGTNVYYAQVTALNAIGETVGSTEASVTTNKLRDSWDPTSDALTWSWTAASGATRYSVYISDQTGAENYLGSSVTTSFKDDGSTEINSYVFVPTANTTGAPKFKSMCVSNNVIWATNDVDNMYYVYHSGTGKNIGIFTEFYGGGILSLEQGGREVPVAIKHYQSGQGEGRATALCKTPDGKGAVWQLQLSNVTVGDTSFSVGTGQKVVGSFGTESILGVVQTDNDIMFPNRKGWFSLGPEKQYFGLLRTNEQSSNIRPYWRSLYSSGIANICSYYYDAKIFISVPTSSAGNDRMIIYDTERANWSVDWSIGARQYLEYTDTAGSSHFLYIPTTGTKLIELSDHYLNDLGAAFTQSYTSPLLSVSKDKTDIFSHFESIVELGRPQGSVNFKILGVGKDDSFATLATKTITNFGSSTGVGSDLAGGFFATSTNDNSRGGAGSWAVYFTATPSVFTQSTTKKAIKKRAKVYALQFNVSSNTGGTDFTILSLQAKGQLIPSRIPSSWTN